MAATLPHFVKKEGNSILFDQDGEFCFYVPEQYFNSRNAEVQGQYIQLLGIINYAIFDKNGKHNGLKTFKLPTQFLTCPSEITTLKEVSLIKSQEPIDYRVLHYKKGDAIIVENPAKDIVNTENVFTLFLITAKFPTTIPYTELHTYFKKSGKINGFEFPVNQQLFGVLVSEICRDPRNEEIPFRLSGLTDMNAYKPLSVKDTPKYVSPYASISSENWDNAVVGAALEKPGKTSPLEPVLMG